MRHFLFPMIPLVFVAACGGSSGRSAADADFLAEDVPLPVLEFAATNIDELNDLSTELVSATREFGPRSDAPIPTSGTANYRGTTTVTDFDTLTLVIDNPDDPSLSGLSFQSTGEVVLQVSFETATFEGEVGNFFDVTGGAPRGGALVIENGVIDPDASTDLVADVTGTFDYDAGTETINSVFRSNFVDDDAELILGNINGTRTNADGDVNSTAPFTVRLAAE